jgi:hypothetical protein
VIEQKPGSGTILAAEGDQCHKACWLGFMEWMVWSIFLADDGEILQATLELGCQLLRRQGG